MDSHRHTRRLGLYPPIEPIQLGYLDVGDGHSIYYEECGQSDGLPVIGLHGGPGGGAAPAMRRFFDPKKYRIILFDQRGCGRSRPFASVEQNTTPHLISDIEKIRALFGIDKWIVFGGSWGATLALSYARACPEHTMALILRGVFTCSKPEIRWFYEEGASTLFPDMWARFTERLTLQERQNILRAYHARVMVDDPGERRADVIEWARWESALISLHADPELANPEPRRADTLARLETHYFVNQGFLERDGILLDDVDHLKSIPGTIIQGRYDMVTPPRTAYLLNKAWQGSNLEIIPDAGHAAGEPGTIDGLVRATNLFAARFS